MWNFILQWVLIFSGIFLITAVVPGIIIKSRKTRYTSSHELQGIPAYLLSAGVFSFCCGLVWFGLMIIMTLLSESDHPQGMLTLSITIPLNAIAGVVFVLVQQKLSKNLLNNPETFIAGLLGSVNAGIWVAAMTMNMVGDELAPDKLRTGLAVCELVGGVAAGCIGAFLCGNGKLFQWILSQASGELPDGRPVYQGWIVGVTAGTVVSSWLCLAIAFGLANGIWGGLIALLMGWLAAMGFCVFMVPIGGFFVGIPAQGLTLAVYRGLALAQNMAWRIVGEAPLSQSPLWLSDSATGQADENVPEKDFSSPKAPPAARIQKIQHNRQQITYSLPKERFGFLKSRATLELTPTAIKLKDTFLGVGTRWNIPVNELRPSHLTWYFDQNHPVVGINHHKNTAIISSQLQQAEITWLIDEISNFLSTFPAHNVSSCHVRPRYERQWDEQQQLVVFTFRDGLNELKNLATIIGVIGFMALMVMILPWLENEPWESLSFCLYIYGGLFSLAGLLWLLASVLTRSARQTLEINPQEVSLKRHCGKLKVGEPKHATTTLLRPSDICWLYKNKRPALALNFEGSTFTLSPYMFQPEEMDSLLNDVRTTLTRLQDPPSVLFQKPSTTTETVSPKFTEQLSTHKISEASRQRASSARTGDITEQFIAEHVLQFRIPGRLNEIVRNQLTFPLIILVFFGVVNAMMWSGSGTLTESGYYGRPVLTLIWFIGLGWLVTVLHQIFGVTIITLAPEWTEVRYELLSRGFSRRVWTTTITGLHIAHRSTINKTFVIEGLDICTENGKTLKFGSHLPSEEKKWLLTKILAHINTLNSRPGAVYLRQKYQSTHREKSWQPQEGLLKLGKILFALLFLGFWAKSLLWPAVSNVLPEKIAADIVWETTFEKDAKVTELHNIAAGGYIAVGTQDAKGPLGLDAWVRMFTSQGQEVWKQVFDRQQFDLPTAIRPTLDGGYIMVGEISGVNNKNQKAWVVKLNAQGQTIWERTIDRKGFDIGTPHDVQPTPDHGYLLVGEAYSRDAGHSDGWLVKLDEQGNLLWQKFLQGSRKSDVFHAIMPAVDDGYILIGHADYSGWIVKIDAEGEQIWEQVIGGQDADILRSIDLTLDGNYIVAGHTRSRKSNGDYDVWVIKLDPEGKVLWEHTFGNRDWNQANAIASIPDGGYLVGGSKSAGRDGDAWLLKLNAEGNLEWERSFDDGWNDCTIYAVQAALDEGYIAAGNKGDNAWIFKINPDIQTSQ